MVSTDRTRFFQTCLGVFQGGGCRGAAFAGALSEAERRGVAFAGVAGTSAGSIVAALVGAGANAAFLRQTLSQLDFLSLLHAPEHLPNPVGGIGAGIGLWFARHILGDVAKIWEHHGLYSSVGIEDWTNQQLARLLPNVRGRITFGDLPIPTYVVAADVVSGSVKIWSSFTTPEDEVAFSVRCSCSIPAFFQPVQGRYIDGGILSNLPTFVFSGPEFEQNKPFASRILAFVLTAAQGSGTPATGKELFKAAVSTIVDGASALQGRLVYPVHQIAIETGDIQATDFALMDDQKINWLIERGKIATESFFNDELGRVQAVQQHAGLLSGEDELYSALTEALDDVHIAHVVIRDGQTRWAYAIFPTLLAWRFRGVRLQVVLDSGQAVKADELYRRRLLRALGVELAVVQSPGFRGFLLNPEDEALARAFVVAPDLPGTDDETVAVRYYAPFDFAAVQSLWASLRPALEAAQPAVGGTPKLQPVDPRLVIDKLARYVKAYGTSDAHLSMETVPIDSMLSLTKLVRGYKFKQIGQLFDLFQTAKLKPFDTAEVNYGADLGTFVTPPVVEHTGGRHILIQGNTRALYCYKNAIPDMRCIVVRNPGAALPSSQRIELKDVLIGGRTISTADRYGRDLDKDYRNIEWATHHPEETLRNVQL